MAIVKMASEEYVDDKVDGKFVSKSGDTMTGGLTAPSLTVGSREGSAGAGSCASGYRTTASGDFSSARGWKTIANERQAEAAGVYAKAGNPRSYVWSGMVIDENSEPAQESEYYNSHGVGSWNVMPNGGRYDQTYGMYIGNERLPTHIIAMLVSDSFSVPAFSEATSYKPGDHVLYNGKTYEFQVTHAAGAWDDAHVRLCKLPVNPHFTTFRTDRDYVSGEYVFYNGYLYRFRVDHPAGEWAQADVIWTTPKSWLNLFKSEVIAEAQALDIKIMVVNALPETGNDKVLYFVRDNTKPTGDKCDEYMWVNNTWEKIGSTVIDLSNYVQTNDSRLSDARTPTAHKSSHATGGADAIAPSDIGAQPAGDYASSEAIAPGYEEGKTYDQYERVTHDGWLYYANQAITAPEPWTRAHWTEDNMTTPDATLDITAAGSLRVVSANGNVLWQQGYKLASASSATLSNEGFNLFAFAAVDGFDPTAPYSVGDVVAYDGVAYVFTAAHAAGAAWIGPDATGSDVRVFKQAFSLPATSAGRVGDCALMIDNAANASVAVAVDLPEYSGENATISLVVPKGRDLNEMFTIEGGARCELYFTRSPLAVDNLPTWKVVRQDLEVPA